MAYEPWICHKSGVKLILNIHVLVGLPNRKDLIVLIKTNDRCIVWQFSDREMRKKRIEGGFRIRVVNVSKRDRTTGHRLPIRHVANNHWVSVGIRGKGWLHTFYRLLTWRVRWVWWIRRPGNRGFRLKSGVFDLLRWYLYLGRWNRRSLSKDLICW